MTQQARLSRLVTKYRSVGIDKGGEFLLPPASGQELLRELGTAGIVAVGITTWVYVDYVYEDGSQGIAQDLAHEFYVPEDILQSKNAAISYAQLCIDYVDTVAKVVDFVSIEL